MVVAYLEKYTELEGFTFQSNLKNIVENFLRSKKKTKPLIVLDASWIPYGLKDKTFDAFNGRPSIQREEIENFVYRIISLGVNLSVVLRYQKEENLVTWAHKNYQSFKSNCSYLDCLKNEFKCSPVYLKSCVHRLCCEITFTNIVNENYKVVIGYESTHKEVAEIVRNENCIAVIGQVSHYNIHNVPLYIFGKNFNFETLDCTVFDSDKFMKHLELNSENLPLFATLCGNEKIPCTEYKKFHSTLGDTSQKNKKNHFKKIAEIVKKFQGNPYSHLKKISKLTNIKEIHLKDSLDMYLNFKPKNFILTQTLLETTANEMIANNKITREFYELLTQKVFLCNLYLENHNDLYIVPCYKLLQFLRQKIYGVIFYKQNCDFVKECFMDISQQQNKLLLFQYVQPIIEKTQSLSFTELWELRYPFSCNIKWNLFQATISSKLKGSVLINIPSKLLIPVAALYFLAVELPENTPYRVFNETFEIQAFLVVALKMYEGFEKENTVPGPPDYRAIHLSTKFLATCHLLILLNQATGLVIQNKEACVCNYFDGPYFHYVYKVLKNGIDWADFFKGNVIWTVTFKCLFDIISRKI